MKTLDKFEDSEHSTGNLLFILFNHVGGYERNIRPFFKTFRFAS